MRRGLRGYSCTQKAAQSGGGSDCIQHTSVTANARQAQAAGATRAGRPRNP